MKAKTMKRDRLRKKKMRVMIFIPWEPLPYGKAWNRMSTAPVPMMTANQAGMKFLRETVYLM